MWKLVCEECLPVWNACLCGMLAYVKCLMLVCVEHLPVRYVCCCSVWNMNVCLFGELVCVEHYLPVWNACLC